MPAKLPSGVYTALFGANHAWDEARRELRESLIRTWQQRENSKNAQAAESGERQMDGAYASIPASAYLDGEAPTPESQPKSEPPEAESPPLAADGVSEAPPQHENEGARPEPDEPLKDKSPVQPTPLVLADSTRTKPKTSEPRSASIGLVWGLAAFLFVVFVIYEWKHWPKPIQTAELVPQKPLVPAPPPAPMPSAAPKETDLSPLVSKLQPVTKSVPSPLPQPLPSDAPVSPSVMPAAEKPLACIVGDVGLRELFVSELRRAFKGRIETECARAVDAPVVRVFGKESTPRAGADCDAPDKHVFELGVSIARPGNKEETKSFLGQRCGDRITEFDARKEQEARHEAVLMGVISLREFLQTLPED